MLKTFKVVKEVFAIGIFHVVWNDVVDSLIKCDVTLSWRSNILPNQSSPTNHFAPSLFTFQGFDKFVYIWETFVPAMFMTVNIASISICFDQNWNNSEEKKQRYTGGLINYCELYNHISIVVWAVENIGPFVCELLCRWLVAVGQLDCRWIIFCLWIFVC